MHPSSAVARHLRAIWCDRLVGRPTDAADAVPIWSRSQAPAYPFLELTWYRSSPGELHRARGDARQAAEHLRIAAAMAGTPDYDPDVAFGLDAEANELTWDLILGESTVPRRHSTLDEKPTVSCELVPKEVLFRIPHCPKIVAGRPRRIRSNNHFLTCSTAETPSHSKPGAQT